MQYCYQLDLRFLSLKEYVEKVGQHKYVIVPELREQRGVLDRNTTLTGSAALYQSSGLSVLQACSGLNFKQPQRTATSVKHWRREQLSITLG